MAQYALLALLFWRAIRKPPTHLPQSWSWTAAGRADFEEALRIDPTWKAAIEPHLEKL